MQKFNTIALLALTITALISTNETSARGLCGRLTVRLQTIQRLQKSGELATINIEKPIPFGKQLRKKFAIRKPITLGDLVESGQVKNIGTGFSAYQWTNWGAISYHCPTEVILRTTKGAAIKLCGDGAEHWELSKKGNEARRSFTPDKVPDLQISRKFYTLSKSAVSENDLDYCPIMTSVTIITFHNGAVVAGIEASTEGDIIEIIIVQGGYFAGRQVVPWKVWTASQIDHFSWT